MAASSGRTPARRTPGRRRSAAAASARRSAPHLLGLTSDWYWEQDAELRFTRVEVRNDAAAEQSLAQGILGKRRWETGVEIEGGWEAHRALLESRAPFRDVLMWRNLPDGARRYISVSGEPTFDTRGRFAGYRGIGRDISHQQHIQQLLKLDQAVTLRLAEAHAPQALSGALEAICDSLRWDCSLLWAPDEPAGVLRPFACWATPDDAGAGHFLQASRGLSFAPGKGLVGVVWQSGEPVWIADVTADPRALRSDLACETGLRAAALFPVHAGGRVAAVLEFTSRRMRQPDKRLWQTLGAIGTQIGQFLGRLEAERAVRESEARFRALTNLSSDWYWELDAEYRFTRLEGRQIAGGDPRLLQRLLGARRWETELEVEGGWDVHRAMLDARQPFHDVLMWRRMQDGSVRYMRVSGEAVFDADGRFTGYRGVGRDVTDEKRAEQMLRLEHDVARLLAAAEDASGGLQGVIRAVCEAEGFACGRYFRIDGELARFENAWAIADPAIAPFIERSRAFVFQAGEGLTGTVWQSGEAVWSADITRDPRVRDRNAWQGTGLRGGFAFPVRAEGKTIGVLNFSGLKAREPDQRLLAASRVIGSQVGQFLQRKQAEASLRESEARFRSLTQMSSDFFWETDEAHRFTQLVHGPEYLPPEMSRGVIGKAAWELPNESPDETGWAAHRARLDQHLPFRDFEFARRMPDGLVRHLSVSGDPRFSPEGAFIGYRGVGRDITEIALARKHIASLAYSDPLTGLANRTSFMPSLDQAVQRARRRNSKLAVVFLDLDGFKQINDAYGHDTGDALLVELAGRLRDNLRASDLIARLGGDEFLVVLEEVQDPEPVEVVAKKLLAETARPYMLPGAQASVTASIGISLFPDDAADAAALMKHADIAMYAAKQAGKNTCRFYSSGPAANDPARQDRLAL
ncbi:MAG TPA: diguanylate cyclase [Burkholderiales bacterium]|nr:diguanylate cyclase [Burkholderiales bacterium]